MNGKPDAASELMRLNQQRRLNEKSGTVGDQSHVPKGGTTPPPVVEAVSSEPTTASEEEEVDLGGDTGVEVLSHHHCNTGPITPCFFGLGPHTCAASGKPGETFSVCVTPWQQEKRRVQRSGGGNFTYTVLVSLCAHRIRLVQFLIPYTHRR